MTDCPGIIWKKHSFGKWEKVTESYTFPACSNNGKVNGYIMIQKRTCSNCGYTEIDMQRVYT